MLLVYFEIVPSDLCLKIVNVYQKVIVMRTQILYIAMSRCADDIVNYDILDKKMHNSVILPKGSCQKFQLTQIT